MADNPRSPESETIESERERDRGQDDAVKGSGDSEEMIVGEDSGDVDPDSATADVDRDDTVEDF